MEVDANGKLLLTAWLIPINFLSKCSLFENCITKILIKYRFNEMRNAEQPEYSLSKYQIMIWSKYFLLLIL